MSFSIKLSVGERTFGGALYYGVTALELGTMLPLEIELERHGEAFVGALDVAVAAGGHDDERTTLQPGELAYARHGNALCIQVGAAGNFARSLVPIGRLKGDLGALAGLGPKVRARLDRA